MSRPPAIEFDKVSRKFGDHLAVDCVSLGVAEGELLAVIGRSGSGKTTLLRLVNGLEPATEGSVRIAGQETTVQDLLQVRRQIGYVVQEGGLFPHLTAAQNVSILGRSLGHGREQQQERIRTLMDLVGLASERFNDRYPNELSGGERQRVGIARALYLDPPIVLMDEPFGSLDPITRMDLQDEFLRMKGELGKTILLVTHDIDEAMRLGDRIAVMESGRVVQIDTPAGLAANPSSEYVARFLRRFMERTGGACN